MPGKHEEFKDRDMGRTKGRGARLNIHGKCILTLSVKENMFFFFLEINHDLLTGTWVPLMQVSVPRTVVNNC